MKLSVDKEADALYRRLDDARGGQGQTSYCNDDVMRFLMSL